MSVATTTPWLDSEAPAVTFMPLPRWDHQFQSSKVKVPMVERMLREVGGPLRDLSRRLKRQAASVKSMTVLVAGCGRRVGCTSFALAMAAAASQDGPVALLEGDWDHPVLREMCGMAAGFGWEDAFQGTCGLNEVQGQIDLAMRLAVFPLRRASIRGDEIVSRVKSDSWIQNLQNEYGLIVIDGGAVWQTAAMWSDLADQSVIVCDANQAGAEEWARAWDRLEEAGAQVAGIVEMFA